jgi:predicted RNA-binding protein with PUA-like domain
MQYLLKTEPSEYSFANLARDQSTIWDGVSNPQALKYLREMSPGDRLIIYHTGDERRTVGTAVVVTVDDKKPKNPAITIKAGKKLPPVTLSTIKSHKLFKDSPIVRQGRLSVVPLTEEQFSFLLGE